jgi:hypothetical protein
MKVEVNYAHFTYTLSHFGSNGASLFIHKYLFVNNNNFTIGEER